jgi:hypothetical protein
MWVTRVLLEVVPGRLGHRPKSRAKNPFDVDAPL